MQWGGLLNSFLKSIKKLYLFPLSVKIHVVFDCSNETGHFDQRALSFKRLVSSALSLTSVVQHNHSFSFHLHVTIGPSRSTMKSTEQPGVILMGEFLGSPAVQQINYPLSRKLSHTHTHKRAIKDVFHRMGSTLNEKCPPNNNLTAILCQPQCEIDEHVSFH